MAGNHLVMYQALCQIPKKGSCRSGILDVYSPPYPSTLSSLVVKVGTLPLFLNQWKSITSNRFLLKMFQGYYLTFRCHAPFSIILNSLTLKAAAAHQPVIQEVNELLVKCV